ncbi:DUF4942 domain-containing protein [Vibrio lentus]|uniref:DUF4942 domain-containing protein n=1 Tax=Vibrio splendidus TaxID=29497 RepID=UPI000C85FA3A|nr:DUF4942 domain-containing protein [Vibrio splendidus]PMG17823.1 hypothetical protein BCU98_00390 [Vibrio splendidus]
MTQEQSVIPLKLLDSLLTKREQLISIYCAITKLQKDSLAIEDNIEQEVPRVNEAYLSVFSGLSIVVSQALDDSTQNRSHARSTSLRYLSQEEIDKRITTTIDRELWKLVFNRLGLMGMMSTNQRAQLNKELTDSPKPFTIENLEPTMRSYYQDRDLHHLNCLIDTLQGLNAFYVSNQKPVFNKKIIIEKTTTTNNTLTVILQSISELRPLVASIWKWSLHSDWKITEDGVASGDLWDHLNAKVNECDGDWDLLRQLDINGIKFKFFKKGTAHIELPAPLIDCLNAQIEKTQFLNK